MVFGGVAPRDREYLFVDGGCLRSSVRTICRDLFNDENEYQPYIPTMAGGEYDKIFYYDAVPGKEHGEAQATYEARVQGDHDRFAQIQALDRVHVALGKIVGADRRQKGVDVQLAVDMMTHAFRGNITRATLFAGDADFLPLIRALVGEGLHVTLWHPPQANAGPGNTWSYINLEAPSASLTRAIKVFDAINNWNIEATGSEWIET